MSEQINGFRHVYRDKKSARTLLLLHGTGGDEHDLVPFAEELDPTANILSPRGKVLEYGNPRFFRRSAEGVFDREDLKARSQELAAFLAVSSQEYGFSPRGVIAVGYSNGANIALHLMARDPEALNKAILMRPMSAALPDTFADLSPVRTLVLAGAFDQLVGPGDADYLSNMLAEKGAQVEMKKVSAGHGLTPEDSGHAQAWLRKF